MSDRPSIEDLVKMHGLSGIHPALALFPLMSEDELTELTASVKANGFLHPATATSAGILLDGRNRLLAGWDAQLDPTIIKFDPESPVEFILDENLRRRATWDPHLRGRLLKLGYLAKNGRHIGRGGQS